MVRDPNFSVSLVPELTCFHQASSSFKKIYNVMKAQGYIDRASEAAKATLAPKKRVVENFQDHLIDPQ